ncbi:MAG: hypothetical protein GYB65_12750 [Chloroflexi bacterium]|nr:hypothetical protein [Chloroflexota bacterium]
MIGSITLLALSVIAIQDKGITPTLVAAYSPEAEAAFDMMQQGQGADALYTLSEDALQRGGWEPAPGDVIFFDVTMPEMTRAAISIIDAPPGECADPRLARLIADCNIDYSQDQNLVRFGRTTFANLDEDGNLIPRDEYDDLLSTYIEEMAHSWQEFMFETEGRGYGTRSRPINWTEGLYWAQGWEYQAKMYVLSLDGGLLQISDAERETLRDNICSPDGYANPTGQNVMPYSAPAGWPNPDGWPVAVPTPEALETFCE